EVLAAAAALAAALGPGLPAASAPVLPPLAPVTAELYPRLPAATRARHMLNALAQGAAAETGPAPPEA
ncbi:hypothetical protein, partial [Mangrovicoccus algicola]